MSNKILFGLLAIVCLTLVSCEKLKDALPDVSITPNLSTGNIPVNALSAGATYSKDTTITATAVLDAIKNAGKSTTAVKTVVITTFELTIPTSVSWTFADVESAEVLINDVVVGTLPAGTTGKVATFAAPATQADVKAAILSATGFKLKYSIKAKNATTASLLTGILKTKVTIGA